MESRKAIFFGAILAIIASVVVSQYGEDDRFCDLGKCYFVFRKVLNWYDAADACQSLGLRLATMNSMLEIGMVRNRLFDHGYDNTNNIWLGAFTPDRWFQKWLWLTGAPLTQNLWLPNQPDHANGTERCLHMTRWDFQWNDLDCSSTTAWGNDTWYMCDSVPCANAKMWDLKIDCAKGSITII